MKFKTYLRFIFPTNLFILLMAVSASQSGCVVAEEHPGVRREVIVEQPAPPPRQVVVEVPPPQYETVVVENEAPAPVQEIIVREPMPPPREEVVIVRPSARHVWVAGYWHWEGNRYGWVRGHWMLPPREGVVWVAPRVEHRPGGNVFIGGFWRHGGVAVGAAVRIPPPAPGTHVLGIRDAPPPLRHEGMTVSPSPRHVWIAGYWRHDGRAYVWVTGHWEKPPRENFVWIAPRWESREGGWVFIEGHWDLNPHRPR
jgi:hypothetical protein